MPHRTFWLAFALGLVVTATGSAKAASYSDDESETERASLRERFGVVPAERALRSSDPKKRERALERLGALGTPRALDLLVTALEPSGAAQAPRERLIAVRALAPHVKNPRVRDGLVRVMTGIGTSAERSDPLQGLLRDTAALALAASRERSAEVALARALRQPGRVAEAARAALTAYPPNDLDTIVRSHGTPTLELVRLLEALGGPRAIATLREVARRGTPELRLEAALSLARLGSFEGVDLAKPFATRPKSRFSLAAAEILTLAGDPSADTLVAQLLEHADTRGPALELARKVPGARVRAALLRALEAGTPSELPAVVSALAQSGGAVGIRALGRLGSDPVRRDLAARALALTPGKGANAELARWARDPGTRRFAARASALRRIALGEGLEGDRELFDALLASKHPADRAAGAFGKALTDGETARALLRHADPAVVEAAARAAPFVGAADAAARTLLASRPSPTRTQLALSLLVPSARALVPTEILEELVSEGTLAAPLALHALCERDSQAIRARILEHLASPDPSYRAHAALGLGASADPTALGLLEAAYRFEVEPSVRRAIVHALSRRPEGVRARTLRLAATLDPDRETRELARHALQRPLAPTFETGTGTLSVALVRSDGARRGAIVRLPSGLAVPVLADPDGIVTLAGFRAGNVALRLALVPERGEAPGHRTP